MRSSRRRGDDRLARRRTSAMIALPAVDLRDGACVQLVGGDYAAERVRLADPVAVAADWAAAGFAELHVVDLDRATGRGDNDALVRAILGLGAARVQVGGGFSTDQRIEAALEAGAAAVVVGTRAIEDDAWLAAAAGRWPDRLVVAADVQHREVVTRGWTRRTGVSIDSLLPVLGELPLAGILITAVHREGQLTGPDVELVASASAASPVRVQASGGIRSVEDLRALDEAGAAKAVIGMALYTGRLDRRAAAEEFGR
ncbi:MAG: HisA/HisF-related TIM barrel protein [Gemmatimonadales bacterium]